MSCLLNQSPCALPLRDKGDPAGKVGGLTSTLSVTRTNQTSKSCCGEFLRCWVTLGYKSLDLIITLRCLSTPPHAEDVVVLVVMLRM